MSTAMIVSICILAFAVSKIVLFSIWYWRRKKMCHGSCEVNLSGIIFG
jgi:hypothetical protein